MSEDRIVVPPGTDFNDGFDQRYYSGPLETQDPTLLSPSFATVQFTVLPEARANYLTLKKNDQRAWGMTGLLTYQGWSIPCYGQVTAGTMLLFPGTYDDVPPPYVGKVRINCREEPPMISGRSTLHQQMCDFLEINKSNFLGFSIRKYPFSPKNIGYTSCTCNQRYFGSCQIPDEHKGIRYHELMAAALQQGLGDL